ncbi:MAG: hypothetical protein KF773_26370 [Deltaproteobacteria bacterium]|nr:hypothetical protein [Deltaproteobacteria bacterium]
MMMRRAVVIALVAACGGSSAPIGNQPPKGNKDTLGGLLEQDVGRGVPVAIVGGKQGLRALSADGARQKVLVPGSVPWVLVDNRSRVVWFGEEGDPSGIRAVDLDAPASAPVVARQVVTGMPGTGAGEPHVGIRYVADGTPPIADDLTSAQHMLPRVFISLRTPPALEASGGILDLWGQTEEFAADLKAKAKLLETAWLAQVAERGRDGAFALLPDKVKDGLRVPDVDPAGCDNDADRCGHAEEVAPTKLWRVAVSFTCGDGCYTEWKLYDPTAKKFLEADWAGRLKDAWVARDGSAFIVHGAVYRFDRGALAETPDAESLGGGWLGGGYYYQ